MPFACAGARCLGLALVQLFALCCGPPCAPCASPGAFMCVETCPARSPRENRPWRAKTLPRGTSESMPLGASRPTDGPFSGQRPALCRVMTVPSRRRSTAPEKKTKPMELALSRRPTLALDLFRPGDATGKSCKPEPAVQTIMSGPSAYTWAPQIRFGAGLSRFRDVLGVGRLFLSGLSFCSLSSFARPRGGAELDGYAIYSVLVPPLRVSRSQNRLSVATQHPKLA